MNATTMQATRVETQRLHCELGQHRYGVYAANRLGAYVLVRYACKGRLTSDRVQCVHCGDKVIAKSGVVPR